MIITSKGIESPPRKTGKDETSCLNKDQQRNPLIICEFRTFSVPIYANFIVLAFPLTLLVGIVISIGPKKTINLGIGFPLRGKFRRSPALDWTCDVQHPQIRDSSNK